MTSTFELHDMELDADDVRTELRNRMVFIDNQLRMGVPPESVRDFCQRTVRLIDWGLI